MEPCKSLRRKWRSDRKELIRQRVKILGKENKGKSGAGALSPAAEANFQLVYGHIFVLVHLSAYSLCFPEYFVCEAQNFPVSFERSLIFPLG